MFSCFRDLTTERPILEMILKVFMLVHLACGVIGSEEEVLDFDQWMPDDVSQYR